MSAYYETNKKRWNELVGIHAESEEYDIEGFLAGKNSLHHVELDILSDVSGKSLLHLQCHFGMDTVSWSRLGAKATGVDVRDTAIELAREIAKRPILTPSSYKAMSTTSGTTLKASLTSFSQA